MIALLTACLFFEILVHVVNIASAKAHAKTVFGHLKCFNVSFLTTPIGMVEPSQVDFFICILLGNVWMLVCKLSVIQKSLMSVEMDFNLFSCRFIM